MDLTIQAVLLNVSDLKQSTDFYQDVFGLHVVSGAYRVTALMVSEKNRRQVVLLANWGATPPTAGEATSGPGCSPSRLGRS